MSYPMTEKQLRDLFPEPVEIFECRVPTCRDHHREFRAPEKAQRTSEQVCCPICGTPAHYLRTFPADTRPRSAAMMVLLPHVGHDHGAHHWAPFLILAALVAWRSPCTFARRAREVTR
jgi:hypothetical protein